MNNTLSLFFNVMSPLLFAFMQLNAALQPYRIFMYRMGNKKKLLLVRRRFFHVVATWKRADLQRIHFMRSGSLKQTQDCDL